MTSFSGWHSLKRRKICIDSRAQAFYCINKPIRFLTSNRSRQTWPLSSRSAKIPAHYTTTTVMSARPRNDLVRARVSSWSHTPYRSLFFLPHNRKTVHGLSASTIVASLGRGICYGFNWPKRSNMTYILMRVVMCTIWGNVKNEYDEVCNIIRQGWLTLYLVAIISRLLGFPFHRWFADFFPPAPFRVWGGGLFDWWFHPATPCHPSRI